MQRPVIGRGGIAVAGEPAGGVNVDEVVGDWPALRVGQKVALQIGASQNDQIAERQRQSDQLDRSL
jgi:hypothetical protein